MNLSGLNAIVTGGAARIGRELTLRLAAAGVNVAVHCRSHAVAAVELVAELRDSGVRAVAIPADFMQPSEAARVVLQAASAELGPIQILVNNAAIFEPTALSALTEDLWRRHLTINLEAPAFLCREFARHLPKDQHGKIVNMTDWRGLRPVPGHLPYTVAKAGLVALTRILAQELGPRVQVNAIAPGAILAAPGQDADALKALALRNPLHQTGSPSEIADALVYLLQSDFVNGEVLTVTGGEEL